MMENVMRTLTTVDRRTLLKSLSLLPVVGLPSVVRAEADAAGLIATDVCMLTPQVTEGPFYLDPGLIRADITEGRPGLPMQLRLQVVTADCTPVAGARVDVWHCDANGVYSGVRNLGGGVDATGQTFMRGTQSTDASGVATFQTIYPGWYPGRTTHIHYKVILEDRSVLTSQIFFAETVTAGVYGDHPAYAAHGAQRDVMNAEDRIAARAGDGAYGAVRMTEPDGAMEAALVVGIDAQGASGGLLDRLLRRA